MALYHHHSLDSFVSREEAYGLRRRQQHRLLWAATRSVLEAGNLKHRKYGEKKKRNWSIFEALIVWFGALLKFTPFYARGLANAEKIVLRRFDLHFDDLPEPFHGYTILHMTDLHLDMMPGMEGRIVQRVRSLAVDLCVLTGDYREKVGGGFKQILLPMQALVSGVRAKDGILATFGNHDTFRMADAFEQMGIETLANESMHIERGGERIWITGLDDPYYYYTDQSLHALEQAPEGFKIALVHAPSLFDLAAENGYRLYLCGHTHGGQICLPGGMPVIVHLRHGRKFYRGRWTYNGMTGYTGQGTGVVGIPIRFNTQSEITLLRLLRR